MEIKLRDFESQILYFNGMYKLPVAATPSTALVIAGEKKKQPSVVADKDAVAQRLAAFKATISDEVSEVNDIILSLRLGQRCKDGEIATPVIEYTELEFLVDLADWLGDIQVYCASEMAKFGIPLKETLSLIMSSNFSKQGADGNPIYDANGKVQKGPGYWKPEPQIKAMLEERMAESKEQNYPDGIVWR